MRHTRPRTRTDRLRLSAAGQLTIPIPLDDHEPPPAWDARWRRCLSFKRCAARAGDKTRCRTRATPGRDLCRLHSPASARSG